MKDLIISHFEYENATVCYLKNIDKATGNSLTKNNSKFLDDLKVICRSFKISRKTSELREVFQLFWFVYFWAKVS